MECIFCKIINKEIPSFTIYEDDYVKCFLDVNPRSNGHMLIIPKKHYKDLFEIDQLYLNKISETSKKMITLLNEKLKPDGIQLVQNNGNIQEVKHYHLHLVPNYEKNEEKNVEEIYNLLTK